MDSNILITWGAVSKKILKGEYIFSEGDDAIFYYQVVQGEVKMININPDGKEFIQGVFTDGESFGEPALLINRSYPSSAVAVSDSLILRISKNIFFNILDEYRSIEKKLLITLAKRLYSKAETARELIFNTPENRIIGYLNSLRIDKSIPINKRILIDNTRQEIANFTGLRVETVIRTLKKMQKENKVEIINRKLFY
ncbi:MAG: Crp/Fnr family transcriptional regulator [Chlorobiota bacterium]|jgi:CRP/FNR family transcriptional regulator|nr:MAG: Crp/Fnr family transcriptional regulator [Chlorobiota bacterium]